MPSSVSKAAISNRRILLAYDGGLRNPFDSMENLTYPWMNLFFGSDTEKYKFVHLANNINFFLTGDRR